MKKYQLIRSFTIFSFLAFILTGIILSAITYLHIRNDKLENLYEVSRMSVDTTFQNIDIDLNSNDLLTERITELIQTQIRDHLIYYDVQSISILNNNSELIMLDDPAVLVKDDILIIEKLLFEDHLTFVNSDSFNSNDLNQSTNGLSFNLYLPINKNFESKSIIVIRFSDTTITTHARELVFVIVGIMIGGLFLLYILMIGIMFRTSKTLISQNDNLQRQNRELETAYAIIDKSYLNTVIAVSNAIDARDSYTAGHSSRVSEISLAIAHEMKFTVGDKKTLEYASLFHDIGKIGISDLILNKADKLTEKEFFQMKKHPEIGVEILLGIEFLEKALPIIKHHHERYDGKGYPDGLLGEQIPIGSRIVAIADSFDAMTTNRPYRKAMSENEAIDEITRNRDTQFDSEIVDVFLKVISSNTMSN